jgi:hypothetical protein
MTMIEILLAGVGIVALLIFIGLAVLAVLAADQTARERRRIDREVQFADWELRQLRRLAIRRLLDEARRHLQSSGDK